MSSQVFLWEREAQGDSTDGRGGRNVTTEADVDDAARGQNAGNHEKVEEAQSSLSYSFRGRCGPTNILISIQRYWFGRPLEL